MAHFGVHGAGADVQAGLHNRPGDQNLVGNDALASKYPQDAAQQGRLVFRRELAVKADGVATCDAVRHAGLLRYGRGVANHKGTVVQRQTAGVERVRLCLIAAGVDLRVPGRELNGQGLGVE